MTETIKHHESLKIEVFSESRIPWYYKVRKEKELAASFRDKMLILYFIAWLTILHNFDKNFDKNFMLDSIREIFDIIGIDFETIQYNWIAFNNEKDLIDAIKMVNV